MNEYCKNVSRKDIKAIRKRLEKELPRLQKEAKEELKHREKHLPYFA